MGRHDRALFREEALQHHKDRLHGEIRLAVPIAWQLVGYLLLTIVVIACIFLATGTYARVEAVHGSIVLDRGIAPVVPSRPGRIVEILAAEGTRVRAGDPLVRIRSDEVIADRLTGSQRILSAIDAEVRGLSIQSISLASAAAAEQARLVEQQRGLSQELASLETQISMQRRLVEVAEREFESVQGLASSGFISQRDLAARESALISRRQQLSQFEQARAAKSSGLAEMRRHISQAAATARVQSATIESGRAQLEQRLIEAESGRGYELSAPLDGFVTAVTARVGQPVVDNEPLLIVVPARSRPRVELIVPTQAAGFLAVGQSLNVAIDAFPYQHFGTIAARITEVSSVATPRPSARSADEAGLPSYLVTAELEHPWVWAFGERRSVTPGMTLTARIVTERRSLLAWLFQPLFAVSRR